MISVQADGQDAVTYQLNNNEWQPQGSKFLKWESETMNFTAYYPSLFNGTITQPTEYTSVESLAAADFMSFSGPQTSTNNSNNLTLTMERKMARVVVKIDGFKDQYAGAKIDNVNSLSICGVKAYKHTDNKFYALIKPCEAQNSATFLSLDVAEGESKQQQKRSPASLLSQPAIAIPISSPWVRTRYLFPVSTWQIGLRGILLEVKQKNALPHTSPLRQMGSKSL